MKLTETYGGGEVGGYQIFGGSKWRRIEPNPNGDLHVLSCTDDGCLGCWVPNETIRSIDAWLTHVPGIYPEAISARVVCYNKVIERRRDDVANSVYSLS
jgi:hypothetical protein